MRTHTFRYCKAAILIITYAVCSACSPQGYTSLAPLHRLYKPSPDFDHFGTTSKIEKDDAVNAYGYIYEGVVGFVYTAQQANTVPLHRLYKGGQTRDHFLTADNNEKNNAVAMYGYTYEGVVGCAHSTHQPDTVPLYRLYKSSPNYDHFFTVDESEKHKAVKQYGYIYEGVIAYIYPVGFTPAAIHNQPRCYDDEVCFIGNSKITIGVSLNYGGAITYLIDNVSNNKRTLVNTHDVGRLIQIAIYEDPPDSKKYNPVQGGDTCNNPTGFVNYSILSDELYVKCKPLHWYYYGQCNVKSDIVLESWIKLFPDFARVRHKVTHLGTDIHAPTNRQETPAVYAISDLYRQVIYEGSNPWCGKPFAEHNEMNWEKLFTPTERWSALVDDNDIGILVYHPQNQSYPIQNQVKTVFTNMDTYSTHFMAALLEFGLHGYGDTVEFEYLLIPGNIYNARQTIYKHFRPEGIECQNNTD